MSHRSLTSVGVLALVCGIVAFAPATVAGQGAMPRTPDGQPDLRGVWNFSTATPMERPEGLAEKETLTAEEAAEWEKQLAGQRAGFESELEDAPLEYRVGYSLRVWFEWGDSLDGQRMSLVVDPP